MSRVVLIGFAFTILGWIVGFIQGRRKTHPKDERNYLPLRIIILLIIIAALAIGAYILKDSDPNLTTSELVKIITGGLIVIGLLYSILSFEVTLKKNIKENRVRKSAATFNAVSEWYKAPLIDHAQTIRKFEESKNYQLLHQEDLKPFDVFFSDPTNLDFRKAVMGIFNYFETICAGLKEDVIDERFTRNFYEAIFKAYYKDWIGYFNHRRNLENDPTLWKDFTTFTEKWSTTKN